MSPGYKHAAPLGLNAGQFAVHHPYVLAWFPRPAGWGPQPLRVSTTRYLRFVALNIPSVLRITYYVITCRPAGALGCLVHVACYKHVAPLGLNTAASPPVFSFSASLLRCVKYSFRIALSPVAPLGL